MELRELLAHLGRRLWLLVIIPVAALLLVLGLNAPSGTQYTSSVNLRATNPIGDPTVASINLVAGSLVNAATNDEVVTKIAQAAGVSADRVGKTLSANRIADTELVHVSYSDSDQAVVDKVIQAAPAAMQDAAFAPALNQARVAQTEGQEHPRHRPRRVGEGAEVDRVTNPTVSTKPTSEATSLRVALATAKGRPDTVTTKPIGDALKAARAEEITAAQAELAAPQYAVDNARRGLAARRPSATSAPVQAASVAESISTDVTPLDWKTRRPAPRGLGRPHRPRADPAARHPEVLRRSRAGNDDEYYTQEGPGASPSCPVTPRSGFSMSGTGRSGSTIVANALGALDDAVSVGESALPWERGITENRLYGCGQRFANCPGLAAGPRHGAYQTDVPNAHGCIAA